MSDLAWDISRRIEDSSWDSDTKALTQKYVQEAQRIQASFIKATGKHSPISRKIDFEYQGLENRIKLALIDTEIDTISELQNIQKEFQDIKELQSRAKIVWTNLIITWEWEWEPKSYDISTLSDEDLINLISEKIALNEAGKDALLQKEYPTFERVGIIQTIIPIWITRAQEVHYEMVWKSARTDDEAIQKNIHLMQQKSEKIEDLLMREDKKGLEKAIKEIFGIMNETEKYEGIFNWPLSNDIEDIEKAFNSDTSKDEKLLKIYNKMRSGWGTSTGNSEWVKEAVSNNLIEDPSFQDIKDKLNDPQIYRQIQEIAENRLDNSSNSEVTQYLENKLWGNLAEKLIDIYVNNMKQIKENKLSLNQQQMLWANIWYQVQTKMKHTLLRDAIQDLSHRWKTNKSYIWLYAEITWLWEEKWSLNDMVSLSDSSAETAFDMMIEVWTMLIPLTGWLKAASWLYKGSKYLKGFKWVQHYATKIPKVWSVFKDKAPFAFRTTAKKLWYWQALTQWAVHLGKQMPERVLRAMIKWPIFHEVHNLITSTMYGTDPWEKSIFWKWHKEEWLKSMLFFFTLRLGYDWIHKLRKFLPKGIMRTWGQIWAQSLAATSALIGVDRAFWEKHEWSTEEFMKILMIVTIYKWYSIRAKAKGKIRAIEHVKGKAKVKQQFRESLDAKENVKGKTKVKQKIKEKNYDRGRQQAREDEILVQDPTLKESMNLDQKIRFKAELEKQAAVHKGSVNNIVSEKFSLHKSSIKEKDRQKISNEFTENILKKSIPKERHKYIQEFETKYNIEFSQKEKDTIIFHTEQFQEIQEYIKKLDKEIQKEVQSYISKTGMKNGKYYIETKDGIFLENLSESEWKETIKPGKEEYIKGSSNFQSKLKEVGMFELWNIKDKIITTIGDRKIQISESNFLDNIQIKNFFCQVLRSIGELPPPLYLSLDQFMNRMKRRNGEQFSGNMAEVNSRWETKFIDKFRKKFYPPNGTFEKFKIAEFAKAIK